MMAMIYRTVAEAAAAAGLDYGYDPFLVGRLGRPTKAKLQELGYIVDPAEYARRRDPATIHAEEAEWATCPAKCREGHRWDGGRHDLCPVCGGEPVYRFACDNGHCWDATPSEDDAVGHVCPTCGEYWQ